MCIHFNMFDKIRPPMSILSTFRFYLFIVRRQMWRHGKISAYLFFFFCDATRDNKNSIPKIYLFKNPSKTVHALHAMNAKSSATFEKKTNLRRHRVFAVLKFDIRQQIHGGHGGKFAFKKCFQRRNCDSNKKKK